MLKINPHFVYDEKKKKTGVVLKLKEFEQCLNALEDYHDYLIITERSKSKEPLVPFEEVMKNLKKRAKK